MIRKTSARFYVLRCIVLGAQVPQAGRNMKREEENFCHYIAGREELEDLRFNCKTVWVN
jgi:hypothetical protein